jgi:hypothetical protein
MTLANYTANEDTELVRFRVKSSVGGLGLTAVNLATSIGGMKCLSSNV